MTRNGAPPLVLAIETSCDETSVAVVAGRDVRAAVTASQVAVHAPFGGVVPEVAARAHLVTLPGTIRAAVREAGIAPGELDAVAATAGPGLVGALLVGVSAAKTLAVAWRKPFVAVNHLEGHLFAPALQDAGFAPPAIVLLVSGGHTMLVHLRAWGDLHVLGETIDDAAGEAFDKVARLLGLGYPGGPAIDRLAREGNPEAVRFPRGVPDQPYEFSFSGLKTAVANHVRAGRTNGSLEPVPDIAASFQASVVDTLVRKTFEAGAAMGIDRIVLAGGVAANSALREAASAEAIRRGVRLHLPELRYCTDNAAMIAAAASFRLEADGPSSLATGAYPGCGLTPIPGGLDRWTAV